VKLPGAYDILGQINQDSGSLQVKYRSVGAENGYLASVISPFISRPKK